MAMEKTFDAAEAEPRLYAKWEQAGAFKAGANARPGAEPFCIMIPPPNVTGSLHMGHAFNNTLQDILVRWHRMRGFDTLWQPGQDHAGIATQMVVERDMAKAGLPTRRDMGREAFLEKVWDWKEQSGGTIINQLKRLGASCDWSRNAFTMDPNFQTAVIKVFTEMYAKGLIYRGKRLVNWDPHFETAISDLEVESTEVDGHMWHFKYPLAGGATYEYVEKDEDGTVTLRETRDYIAIATTRPETMLGDGAVAVHPDDTRYAPIVGMLCEIPVGPKESRRLIPIITDEYPDPDFGSGAVKITGAHDFNDYGVAQRNGIPCYRLMDTKAAMRSDGAPYAEAAAIAIAVAKGERTLTEAETDTVNLVPEELRGDDRFAARAKVIDAITAEGLAVMTETTVMDEDGNEEVILVPFVENKKIMQPFGDRSKVVIEPMLTDQWFVDTAKIVQPAIDAVRNGDTQILPEREKKVYFHWLENIEPWCISRQLWWGHQIPVWYDKHGNSYCGATFEEAASKAIKERRAQNPAKTYDAQELTDDLSFKLDSTQPGGGNAAQLSAAVWGDDGDDGEHITITLRRDPDVLDTWFSSGLWPIGTLGWPEDTPELQKYFPTSTVITGTDILFFWVARMMMMQLSVVQQVPFKTVYLHGLVRDAKGKKMSKSLGNAVDPLDLIDEYGADALRFTNAAMASLGGALKLDAQRIAGYRNFTTKLWNAARFAEMNDTYTDTAHKLHIECAPGVQGLQTVNRWIIGETGRVREEVDAALENYRFNDAASLLYGFVWGKVCDWYVELSKPLLLDGDDAVKSETRATLAWVLDQCMILLHPIMPFITEELWNTTATRGKMLVHTDWPTYQAADLIDENADLEMNWVIGLIESIRSARAEMHVPAGLKVDMLHLGLDEAAAGAWTRSEALIMKLARVQSLTHVTDLPKGCITLAVEGGTFALPLADIIDVGEEKSRLEKVLEKLGKELGGIKGRLNNPKFVASAPDEVVEENRERLAQGEDEATKIKAALARLAEIG